MDDVDRLNALVAAGELLPPTNAAPGLVDLARAVAELAGAADLNLTPTARQVRDAIGAADHYVLVLLDGLGLELVEARSVGFLTGAVALSLRTVFPSSTAPALTSLATGLWPGQHAVPGWWTYLPERGVQTTILPFVERFTERPLTELGVAPAEAFPAPVLRSRLRYDAHAILPAYIAASTYSRYSAGGGATSGYESLPAGVDATVRRVKGARAPSFTYLYYAGVDAAGHEQGPASDAVADRVALVERELERLATVLAGRARLVATADHGQIFVPEADKVVLAADDELLALLVCPPTGEPRTPLFHCRPGAAVAFGREFRRRFGERFLLLTTDEVEALRLFGPAPLAAEARRRLGDYVAIGLGASVLLYDPAGSPLAAMKGFHGGLTPAEMLIPLILA